MQDYSCKLLRNVGIHLQDYNRNKYSAAKTSNLISNTGLYLVDPRELEPTTPDSECKCSSSVLKGEALKRRNCRSFT